jgi:hypothetical protein
MRIRVAVSLLSATGGMELAALRLANALHERGHDVAVLHGAGTAAAEAAVPCRTVPALERQETPPPGDERDVAEILRGERPDLIIVVSGASWLVRAAASVAPTASYVLAMAPVCPDGSKYWLHAGRACRVRAGEVCRVLRPVLGCTSFPASLSPAPMARFHEFSSLLARADIRVMTPSTDLRTRVLQHGADERRVAVLPNLGLRLSAARLEAAARATPPEDRDAVV